jgi:copper chaperone CopZ
MEPLHLTIEGMTCAHCVRAVDQITTAIADEGYTAFVA